MRSSPLPTPAFALSGAATVNGTEIGWLTATQADAGETLHVSATEETVLYIVGLPPVRSPGLTIAKVRSKQGECSGIGRKQCRRELVHWRRSAR
ncbi:MAG: hypothetical protein WAM72_24230 [Xanthobacteraceae bacterium]